MCRCAFSPSGKGIWLRPTGWLAESVASDSHTHVNLNLWARVASAQQGAYTTYDSAQSVYIHMLVTYIQVHMETQYVSADR